MGPPEIWVGVTAAAAIVAAHLFSFGAFPAGVDSRWAEYLAAPVAWGAGIGFTLYVYRRIPAAVTERTEDRQTILLLAALSGAVLLAMKMLGGVFGEFAGSPIEHSPRWLAANLLLAGAPFLAVEASRATLLRAFGPRAPMGAWIGTSLLFVLLQFPLGRFYVTGSETSNGYWLAVIVPLVAMGMVAGYFAIRGGLWGALLVAAPILAFTYYSPVLPEASWPVTTLLGFAGPAISLLVADSVLARRQEVTAPTETRRPLPQIVWAAAILATIGTAWISFGFFGYQPSFVPSESMAPQINRGDVVLTGPADTDSLAVGDVILFEAKDGRNILHRIVAIEMDQDGDRLFVTKGDNNRTNDQLPVRVEQIAGRYVGRAPILGWVPIALRTWFLEPLR